ncbi:hypothetical protein I4F81_010521 [Pyropia yezoensis]|uniref:Uncharacterized protein n=1 Tax=Pyropia yezoensis TaxID=2788 RepID=A0ACC3CCJ8_PYRYE|nr:hypothetical protein I4F81_010521 [Neopyropia yezoensis]
MGQTCSACVPTEYLPRPGLLTPKPPSPQLLSSGAAAASPRCGHEFHLACIYEWLERSPYCPVCARRMVFEEWS